MKIYCCWLTALFFILGCGAGEKNEVNRSEARDSLLDESDDDEDIVAEIPVAISGSYLSLCSNEINEQGRNEYTCNFSEDFQSDLIALEKDYALIINGKKVPIFIRKSKDGRKQISFEIEVDVEFKVKELDIYEDFEEDILTNPKRKERFEESESSRSNRNRSQNDDENSASNRSSKDLRDDRGSNADEDEKDDVEEEVEEEENDDDKDGEEQDDDDDDQEIKKRQSNGNGNGNNKRKNNENSESNKSPNNRK
ncbi:MAG: hypothetical protein AB8G05_19275 [Oligoflexales bacterium]